MNEQQEKALKHARHKAEPFARLFDGEDGTKVLNALVAAFDAPTLVTDNPHSTVVKAAQRDVVAYIKAQIQLGSGESNE